MIMVSDKHEKRPRKVRRPNRFNNNVPLVVAISVALIVFLLVFFYLNKQNEDYKKIKQYKNKYLVYTKYQGNSTQYPVQVPLVNIKSVAVDAVNKDIDLFVNDFIKDKKSVVSYEYSINGIILSVIVKVVDYNSGYAPLPYFRSYNINLSTLEVIADESLLDFYGIDDSGVEEILEDTFHFYHQEIIDNDYYAADECNYECFLRNRGINDYLEDIAYYVDDGNLVAFKSFSAYSIFGEEEYFKDDNYKFLLVEVSKE